jgi:hypothetical protein
VITFSWRRRRIDTPALRPDLAPMFSAFTRILLALSMAFVFTGQMEAAASHCAKLAQDAAAQSQPAPADAADCHGMADAAPAHHTAPQQTPDAPAPDHCDCIAALKVCAAPASMPGSKRIAPYAWLVAADAEFASLDPSPSLRPPRA